MLDSELERDVKGAALEAPGYLDMSGVHRRAKFLLWVRRSVALTAVAALLGTGAVVAARWPDQQQVGITGPPHISNVLPRGWTLDQSFHGVIPRLSQREAVSIARRETGSKGTVVRAMFGLFTDHNMFRVSDKKLTYHDIRAWIVQLRGVPMLCSGPVDQASPRPPCPPAAAFLVIRDNTGRVIMEYQGRIPGAPAPTNPQ